MLITPFTMVGPVLSLAIAGLIAKQNETTSKIGDKAIISAVSLAVFPPLYAILSSWNSLGSFWALYGLLLTTYSVGGAAYLALRGVTWNR